jgi:hypothetical protein
LVEKTTPWSRFELATSVVIGTDCIGCCKSDYHTITTVTAQYYFESAFIVHLFSFFTS